MPKEITNLTSTFMLIPLNSGDTLRLSSGETSGPIHNTEVENNPKIDKLLRQRAITVEAAAEPDKPVEAPKPAEAAAAEPAETADTDAEPAGEETGDARPRSRKKTPSPSPAE